MRPHSTNSKPPWACARQAHASKNMEREVENKHFTVLPVRAKVDISFSKRPLAHTDVSSYCGKSLYQ